MDPVIRSTAQVSWRECGFETVQGLPNRTTGVLLGLLLRVGAKRMRAGLHSKWITGIPGWGVKVEWERVRGREVGVGNERR